MSTPIQKRIAGTVVSVPVIIVVSVIVNAIVFKILWGWFVSETFGVREIGYFQAAGLVILFRLLMVGYGNERKRLNKEEFIARMDEFVAKGDSQLAEEHIKKSLMKPLISAVTTGIFVPIFLLILGWLVHLFV